MRLVRLGPVTEHRALCLGADRTTAHIVGHLRRCAAVLTDAINAAKQKSNVGRTRSPSPESALSPVPRTKPICTLLVSAGGAGGLAPGLGIGVHHEVQPEGRKAAQVAGGPHVVQAMLDCSVHHDSTVFGRGRLISRVTLPERGWARRPCPSLPPPRTRRRQSRGREQRAAPWLSPASAQSRPAPRVR